MKKTDRIPFQSFRSSENYSLALQRLNGKYEAFRTNIVQKECLKKLKDWHPAKTQFLTQSATAGLMMVADSIGFSHGDEIIVPSFTFVSALNPFVRRGVKLVFVPANENTPSEGLGFHPIIVFGNQSFLWWRKDNHIPVWIFDFGQFQN